MSYIDKLEDDYLEAVDLIQQTYETLSKAHNADPTCKCPNCTVITKLKNYLDNP